MKISDIENRAYCWRDQNGGWQVGRPLIVDGLFVTRKTSYAVGVGDQVIMQPSPTGKATWVSVIAMRPYPAEPIEEPSMKGGE